MRCRRPVWSAHAVSPRANITAATGLAGAVHTTSTAASHVRRRWTATSAAKATASPRANVSRPMATLTTVPAANSTPAASVRRPLHPEARTWKHAAATTQLATATVAAPSAAPRIGKRIP